MCIGAIMLAKTSLSVVITGALSLYFFKVTKLGYSCHEGLLEPPRATKKRQQGIAQNSDATPVQPPRKKAKSLQDERKQQAEITQSVLERRTKLSKGDPIPQQLVKPHEDTNAARDLRSIRPNLESANHSKKSRISKIVPNFDLQLTTLKRSRSPTSSEFSLTDDCSLPLISEVWEQDDTTFGVKFKGCEVPPSKRNKVDVSAGLLGPRSLCKKVYQISSVCPY